MATAKTPTSRKKLPNAPTHRHGNLSTPLVNMAGNLRIARNAAYLYVRTIINTVMGFITVDIMLEALGVDDYGLQSVAGAGIGLFSFLVSVLSTSTSRFITFELGRGDMRRTNDTFCSASIIFTGLAVIMAIVSETVGMWVLHHQLNVPEGRMHAAEIIIHASALSSIITIPQGPYSAVLVAREKFNILAYCSLFGTFAKLGILLLVRESDFDHLILYTVLMTVAELSITLFMRAYCIHKFPEARFRFSFDRKLLSPMLRFSGWELFGSVSRTVKGTVYPMVLNIFHGVKLNAAIGIGTAVSGAVTGLAFTVTSAFKPVIVKHFAKGHIYDMKESIENATLISMIFYGMFAIPLLVELDFVMKLWLGTVPALSAELCAIQLVVNTVIMAYLVPAESLKSMGLNKGINIMQFIEGTASVGATYTALALGMSPIVACAVYEAGLLVNCVFTIVLIYRNLGSIFFSRLVSRTILGVLALEVAIFAILSGISHLLGHSWLTLITVSALSVILFITGSVFLLPRRQRDSLLSLVRRYLSLTIPSRANV